MSGSTEAGARVSGKIRGGRAAASRLEDAYLRNVPAGLRFAYFLCGDADGAEDLVQEAFVRVAGRFRHLRVEDRFDAYLRTTILHLFLSHRRRLMVERGWLRREGVAEARSTAPPSDVGAGHDQVWRSLMSLPPRQRAAIVLRFYEDLSEQDTATLLGCSVGAANQLVVRGLRALRGDPSLRGDER
jgi:RNA polymerase sigma factor (sigma-70 family)